MSFSYHQRSYTVPMLLRNTTQSSHTCKSAQSGSVALVSGSLLQARLHYPGSPRERSGRLVLGASPLSGFLPSVQSSFGGDTNTELCTRRFTGRKGTTDLPVSKEGGSIRVSMYTSTNVYYLLGVLGLREYLILPCFNLRNHLC